MQIFLVFALVIALFAVVFTIQNTAMVTVTFLVWKLNHSLAFIFLLAILAGVLISIFISLPSRVKHSVETTNQKKKIKELDMELMSAKVRVESMAKEVEVYRSKLALPPLEVTSEPVSTPAGKRFIDNVKSIIKP